MPFEKILKQLIDNAIKNYNEQSYEKISEILCDRIEFISPEINLSSIQTPAFHLTNKEEVVNFWKELHQNFAPTISSIKIIQLGKHSIIWCHYNSLNFTSELNIYFNQYSKVYKLTNKII